MDDDSISKALLMVVQVRFECLLPQSSALSTDSVAIKAKCLYYVYPYPVLLVPMPSRCHGPFHNCETGDLATYETCPGCATIFCIFLWKCTYYCHIMLDDCKALFRFKLCQQNLPKHNMDVGRQANACVFNLVRCTLT